MTTARASKTVVVLVVAAGMLGSIAAPGSARAQNVEAPTTVSTAAPPGAPDIEAKWLRIKSDDGTNQLVAVVRPPKGKGRFPAVISLHGGSGFQGAVAEHAVKLSRAGFVVVAGCWLPTPPGGPLPVWCDHTPDPPLALANLEAVARAQRGVRKNRIGVVGFSSGGGAVFNHSWGPWVRALAVDSGLGAGPTGEFVTTAAAPVLLLIGTANETFPVAAMHAFEAGLRANGVTVEAEYFDGGSHVVTINGPGELADAANARLVEFLKKRLR